MKKILDKALEKTIAATIKSGKTPEAAAREIVEGLRKFQDPGGMKVCQNITPSA